MTVNKTGLIVLALHLWVAMTCKRHLSNVMVYICMGDRKLYKEKLTNGIDV
jgi:hypothetical protein